MGVHETKTVRIGRGVALPLPRGLAIDPGEAMLIEQQGDRITLRRAAHRAGIVRKLRALLPVLELIGKQ